MRDPSSRSSSGVRRGSLPISRRYALSVPASSARLDTERAYTMSTRMESTLRRFFSRRLFAPGVRLGRRRADEIGRRRFDERRGQALLPVVDAAGELALDVFHEFVHFVLHLLDLAAHVENNLDAREI